MADKSFSIDEMFDAAQTAQDIQSIKVEGKALTVGTLLLCPGMLEYALVRLLDAEARLTAVRVALHQGIAYYQRNGETSVADYLQNYLNLLEKSDDN